MKAVLTVTILLAFALCYGQEETRTIQWIGKINNALTSAKMSGVQIKISKSGKEVSSFSNVKPGKFETEEFSCGYNYVIVFSKANFVSKSILVDVDKNYFPEDMEELTILESDIELVPKKKDIVYDGLDITAGRANINLSTGELGFDSTFGVKCKGRLEAFDKKVDEALANLANAELIYKNGKYEQAEIAFKVIDTTMISSSVLNKLDTDIQAGITNGPQAQYRKLIAKADSYFKQGDLDRSESLYKRAVDIKETDTHPVKMLKLIDDKRKILLVINEPKPDDRIAQEVVEVDVPVRPIKTEPLLSTTGTSGNASNSGSKNITPVRAYVGDDLLIQKEKYEAYNRELSKRTRNYSSTDYYKIHRTRAYTAPGKDKTANVREYQDISHLANLACKGRLIQENRSGGE